MMNIEEIKNKIEEISNQYSDVRDEEIFVSMLETLENLTSELDDINHFDEIEYQKISDDLYNLRGSLNDALADLYVEDDYDDFDDDEDY